MLNYFKIILSKVSFDRGLFEKELVKSVTKLMHKDVLELKVWCYSNFSDVHLDVLEKVFQNF